MSRAPDRANPWRAKSTVNGLPVDSMAFWISNNLTRLIDLPSFLFGVHFEVFSRLSWLQIVRIVVKTFDILSSKIIKVLTPHSIYSIFVSQINLILSRLGVYSEAGLRKRALSSFSELDNKVLNLSRTMMFVLCVRFDIRFYCKECYIYHNH